LERTGDFAPSKAELESLIQNHNVMMFTKSYCGYSKAAKRLLDSEEIEYFYMEINQEPDGRFIQDILLEMTNQRTVPNVFIKGRVF